MDRPLFQPNEMLPVFLYGTLMSCKLRSLILTGDQDDLNALPRPAVLQGYRRRVVEGKDYPALLPGEKNDCVHGLLFVPRNSDDRRKLDNFEGEAYLATTVEVQCSDEIVEATAYVWGGDKDAVSDDPWDLEEFERDRLEDWLDLFEGMEFI
jgi:gamma-glutamylcyclotransferase (GGCT)/AIG2-like uncharacterized protein YtfP